MIPLGQLTEISGESRDILTLSVLSVEAFIADFVVFALDVKSLVAFDFAVRLMSLAAFDFAAVFRRFFGVDVVFAAFDPDLRNYNN